MRPLLGVCATVALLLAPPSASGQLGAAVTSALDEFVELHRRRSGWPGVAVSIAGPDTVLFARGYGTADREGGPVTADTPFILGSVTKTFTALAVAKLAEDGVVDLDAPIERYLPTFTMRAPFTRGSITLRHLAHHRSGLSQWDGHDRRAQMEGIFDHLAPKGPSGGAAEYSSLNYIILGRVIEAVTGMPYGEFLKETLFEPAGMTTAFSDDVGPRPHGLVQGHRNYFGVDVRAEEPSAPPFLVPAGFVGASARDMGRYGAMLLNGGASGGVRVLEAATVDRLLAPMDDVGPAMAWGRGRTRSTLSLGHAGNARTSSARVRVLPERRLAITVLVNANSGPLFDASATLLDGLHQIVDGGPTPRTWPTERVFKVVVLAGTLLGVSGLARRSIDWRRAGYPTGFDRSAASIGRFALDLGGAAFLVWGLPRLIGVPLPTLVEYFPDVGLGIAVSAGAGALGGVLGMFVRSRAIGEAP